MIRVYVFVEGSTEEMFVKNLIAEHLLMGFNILIIPIKISSSVQHKGGVSTYGKIKKDISRKCKEDPNSWITTMIDYYGLPEDFPKIKKKTASHPIECVKFLEKCFSEDIQCPNFIPNLMLHEFEALLFSQPEAFASWGYDAAVIDELNQIKNEFDTPEHINNSPENAPSKRILKICPKYQKVWHGSGISAQIGLTALRQACAHFDNWLNKLENIL